MGPCARLRARAGRARGRVEEHAAWTIVEPVAVPSCRAGYRYPVGAQPLSLVETDLPRPSAIHESSATRNCQISRRPRRRRPGLEARVQG
eukprot:3932047-Pyramimonas_sp.AAC.1